jgi:hypothetical protein
VPCEHKVDDIWGNTIRSANKITFVLAVLIIEYDHHLARRNGFNGRLYGAKSIWHP